MLCALEAVVAFIQKIKLNSGATFHSPRHLQYHIRSIHEADDDYKEIIKEFESKWEDLYFEHGIWFTNKVHVIIDHVPQAIERTGKGLLGSSEQVVEATHAKFEKFWMKILKALRT